MQAGNYDGGRPIMVVEMALIHSNYVTEIQLWKICKSNIFQKGTKSQRKELRLCQLFGCRKEWQEIQGLISFSITKAIWRGEEERRNTFQGSTLVKTHEKMEYL